MIEVICLLCFWWSLLRGRSRYAPRRTSRRPGEWHSAPHPNPKPYPTPTPWPTPRHSRPLNGDASALVRPYLLHFEQQQRRHELELALAGYDLPGPMWIHGLRLEAIA